MKRGASMFFKIVLFCFIGLLCVIAACSLLQKAPIYYQSPEVSATIVDSFTGKPIEGAAVEVRWSALKSRGMCSSDSMNVHNATATTGRDGRFTIPAWGRIGLAKEWYFYGFDPTISFSKPGYKSSYALNRDNQDPVTFGAIPFSTVKLKSPAWAGNELELENLETNAAPYTVGAPADASSENFSNALVYYVLRGKQVAGGRFIDTADFPKIGYVRAKPELVITHIQSFSTNIARDLLSWNFHTFGLPDDQPCESGFSITFFKEDAKNIAELERKNIGRRDLLFILDNQLLAETYMSKNAGYSDSIPIPSGTQTIYLPLRKHQNIQEINDALKKLVRLK